MVCVPYYSTVNVLNINRTLHKISVILVFYKGLEYAGMIFHNASCLRHDVYTTLADRGWVRDRLG